MAKASHWPAARSRRILAKIIQAVREVLSSFPMPTRSEGPQDTLSITWEQAQSRAAATPESGGQRTRPVLWDLTDGRNGLTLFHDLGALMAIIATEEPRSWKARFRRGRKSGRDLPEWPGWA
jgi:hypothetical protein